jgi:hypothetical protein
MLIMDNTNLTPPMLDGHPFVVGRIVRYVDIDGRQFPMLIVVARKDPTGIAHNADGVIFGPWGARFLPWILYDQTQKPSTWHWPPHNGKQKKPAEAPLPVAAKKAVPGRPLYVKKAK